MERRQFIRNSAGGILGAGLTRGFGLLENEFQDKRNATEQAARPNILWIMLDDCRYDALGCYGRKWPVTPHLDRLASEGVRFDVAIV